MILWTIKLLSSIRRAIAGRKYPHQLAWAVAFGLLLGVVPHGNLLAIVLLLVVLSLKLNHAMAGLTAVGATFVATKLDPLSHRVGEYVLTHPEFSDTIANAWELPLMPWTDLNNTVVMGSFLIGVASLVPVFLLTYPLFRLLAPAESDSDDGGDRTAARPTDVRQSDNTSHPVVMIDSGHAQVTAPHRGPQTTPFRNRPAAHGSDNVDFTEVGDHDPADSEERIAVETRIDVIRMTDHRGTESASKQPDVSNEQPMDEALNYLLRQLRDSQQRKAA